MYRSYNISRLRSLAAWYRIFLIQYYHRRYGCSEWLIASYIQYKLGAVTSEQCDVVNMLDVVERFECWGVCVMCRADAAPSKGRTVLRRYGILII
jgi:hypothetical protein